MRLFQITDTKARRLTTVQAHVAVIHRRQPAICWQNHLLMKIHNVAEATLK